jgi:hypothetical protein
MAFGFIKTEINLPHEYVTAVDIGYPVDAFWFYYKTKRHQQDSLYLLL